MSNKTNLLVDMGIFSIFLVAAEPRITGISIHEWLGVTFAAALIVHLLLHWKWIVSVSRQYFKKLFHTSRLQYVVDILLFLNFTAALMSGIMISRTVLPFFNISLPRSFVFTGLHAASASFTVILAGVHLALHWDWLVAMARRYAIAPLAGLFHKRQELIPVPVDNDER